MQSTVLRKYHVRNGGEEEQYCKYAVVTLHRRCAVISLCVGVALHAIYDTVHRALINRYTHITFQFDSRDW